MKRKPVKKSVTSSKSKANANVLTSTLKANADFFKSKFFITVVVIVVLADALFLARGWLRVTVVPKTATVVYSHSVQSTLDNAVAELGDPLHKLGYSTVHKTSARCFMVVAQSIHIEMSCYAAYTMYGTVPTTGDAKTNINTAAATIQKLALGRGWTGGGPDNQLTKLVSSVTSNIDYNPDATYQKHIGSTWCTFSSTTAYSRPKPAAMSSSINCSRTVNWLGTPHLPNVIYTKS